MPDGPNVLPDDLDNVRVLVTATGATGTVRTRVGSNDSAMPANKVAIIFDQSPGEFMYLKPNEICDLATVLSPDADPVAMWLR